jgi:hypothetical protein
LQQSRTDTPSVHEWPNDNMIDILNEVNEEVNECGVGELAHVPLI